MHLTLEQKIGQLFFVGIPGPTMDATAQLLFDKISPGGVCLFARNIKEAGQTRGLLDSIRDLSSVEPFLSLDQEGGLVDRLRRLMAPMPAANLIPNVEAASRFGKIVAEVVRIMGFNMNFAPVVDVINADRETVSNGLFSRAFGRSADEAAELAAAFLHELQKGGCLGCIKHFPGLGASAVDSHEDLPSVDITMDELDATDLTPYRRLMSRDMVHSVMVAHAAYPNSGLQEHSSNGTLLPSSLSGTIVNGLLRSKLGFDGLVITDDLEMGAIVKNFGIGEACVMALDAGADMLAICANADRINEGYETVLAAVREERVTEDRVDRSLERITAARLLLQGPLPFSTARLAELSDAVVKLNVELTK